MKGVRYDCSKVHPSEKQHLDVINPATGELITTVPDGGADAGSTPPWPPRAIASKTRPGAGWIRRSGSAFSGISASCC